MKKLIAAVVCALTCASAVAQNATGPSAISVTAMDVISGANGFPAIVGIATNTGNALVRDAFVKFNLYDAQGNIVGNTIAHGQNIGPSERWRFEAPFVARNVQSFKLTEISAY